MCQPLDRVQDVRPFVKVLVLAGALAGFSSVAPSPAMSADLPLKMMRPATATVFTRNLRAASPVCVRCIRECRRRGGPFEEVCEVLCMDTCGKP